MLLHAAAPSQDFLQASSFDIRFDDADRNFSPEPASHAVFTDLPAHVNFTPAGPAGATERYNEYLETRPYFNSKVTFYARM